MLTAIPKGSYLKSGLIMIYHVLSPVFKVNHKIEQPGDFIKFIRGNPNDLSDMFYGSDIRNISYMIEKIFDLSNIEYADRMFKDARFNIIQLKMPKVRSAKNMFEGATGARLSPCDFRKLVDGTEMFKFTYIDYVDEQEMSQVEIAKGMFEGSRLKYFDQFKFRSLKSVDSMFRGTSVYRIDSSGFDNVQTYKNIFDSATVKCKVNGKLKKIAEEYGFEKIAKNK